MVYIKLVIFISYGFVLIYDDTLKLFLNSHSMLLQYPSFNNLVIQSELTENKYQLNNKQIHPSTRVIKL